MRAPTDSAIRRRAPLVSIGVAALAAGGLWFLDPNTSRVPLCPLHAGTGLWCPLCGATRASYALEHGHWRLALHDNALYVLGLPLLTLLWWRWARTDGDERLLSRPALWTVLALAAVFAVLRNLALCSVLAPPA